MRKRELKRQAQNWQDEFWAAREKIDLLQVQLRQAFKKNQQVDKERVDWKRWCRAAEGRAAALAEVLRENSAQLAHVNRAARESVLRFSDQRFSDAFVQQLAPLVY